MIKLVLINEKVKSIKSCLGHNFFAIFAQIHISMQQCINLEIEYKKNLNLKRIRNISYLNKNPYDQKEQR